MNARIIQWIAPILLLVNTAVGDVDLSVEQDKGEQLYQKTCAACHSNAAVRAPALSALQALSRSALMSTMTLGKMADQAANLSHKEKRLLAEYLSGSRADTKAWEAAMMCDASKQVEPSEKKYVTGWGLGTKNHRYQSSENAQLNAADLKQLELVWAHAFPGVTEMRSQPVLTSDTVYIGPSSSNSIYAFDLATGCVKWVHRGKAPVRSAISYSELPGLATPIIYYGDVGGFVYAINALTGELLWDVRLRFSDNMILTGTPVVHKGSMYVPISSFEVGKAGRAEYECCQTHGMVVALDVSNGKQKWAYHTTVAAKPTTKNKVGTQLWGPSGAPVWTTPAIDEQRGRLYIGTGQNYSLPATGTSDAIIALDLATGKQAWVFQATKNDTYNMACNSWRGAADGANCPEQPGPDFDFGASVIITQNKQGQDLLLAGQKSGDVWALDPDNNGAVIWNTKLSGGTPVGGIHWGMAVMGDKVFVPIADPEWSVAQWDYEPLAGVAALDITTGKVKWRYESDRGCFLKATEMNMATGAHTVPWPSCHNFYGNSGAALALDDMILAGALNGKLQAFSPKNGRVLWEYDTKRPFETLNGVPGHGGSLDNAGAVAVGGGYMIVQSGYSYINQMPGNVVLVFRKKQRSDVTNKK